MANFIVQLRLLSQKKFQIVGWLQNLLKFCNSVVRKGRVRVRADLIQAKAIF